MIKASVRFELACYHALVLLATACAMILLWAYYRLPQASSLVVVFAFLSAVKVSNYPTWEMRLRILTGLLAGTIALQYTISATYNLPFINVLLPSAASALILKIMPHGAAYLVLLCGFLSYSTDLSVYSVTERIIDITLAGLVALLVSSAATSAMPENIPSQTEAKLSNAKVLLVSWTLFCAIFLYKLLNMPQGIWIVLTIIFVYMTQDANESTVPLVRQRIFAVPAGILLGGLYSAAIVMFDYQLAYLAPLIGTAGFFMLYYRHDFFSFTLFFMFAFTLCADWQSGAWREFHFMQFLFARTLATAIGATLLLIIEKTLSNFTKTVSAS